MNTNHSQPVEIKRLLQEDPVEALGNHLDFFTPEDIEYACIVAPGNTLEFA